MEAETPGFGGSVVFSRESLKSMKKGDSSNSERWVLNNHSGSHVDAPRHFSPDGKTVSDFEANHWVFGQVDLVELPTLENAIIGIGAWCENISSMCQLLLIKTGFETCRDSERYWRLNPGLSPALAFWLRDNRPHIRAVGFDFISLSAYSNRALGREAHVAFLGDNECPILIFEDLKLSACPPNPSQVIALPLLVKDSDGSPITMIAK